MFTGNVGTRGEHALRRPMHVHTIIVGAGTAGSLLAARLSTRSDREVLLVEAGPDYTPATLPPDLADGRRNALSSHDWGHRHRPSTTPIRMGMPRGRVVGGSSAVNTCIAIRPLPRDLDEWVALGLDEWSHEACLPALKAIENDLDYGGSRPDIHGSGDGLPLRRHRPEEWTRWQAALVEASLELGHPACADTNDPTTPAGVGSHAMNQIEGRRVSVAEAMLTPEVRASPNLRIQANTDVETVLFEGDRACGVRTHHNGVVTDVLADQVVICAGSLQTPSLLMRSGIGAPETLRRLGITVRSARAGVGARLLDHPGFAMFLRPRSPGVFTPDGPLIQTVLRCSSGEGPWSDDLQLQVGSFVPLGRTTAPLVTIMAMLGKTHGHGTLQWDSVDLGSRPRIDSRFHEDPRDRTRAVTAMALARDLAATNTMRPLARPLWPRPFTLARRKRIERWVPWATDSGYHPSGTAPMGREDDVSAVTDGRGKVWGCEGLFVADASLFPTIPTGNIHLSVLMVAERIAGWLD